MTASLTLRQDLEKVCRSLASALVDMAETNLINGEPLPLPNPELTDVADAGYCIALFNPRNALPVKAIAVSQETQTQVIVTSQMVLVEFFNHYAAMDSQFRQQMKDKFITKVTLGQAKKLEDLTDWHRIEKMSASEAEENALLDTDNQLLDQELKGLKRKNNTNFI